MTEDNAADNLDHICGLEVSADLDDDLNRMDIHTAAAVGTKKLALAGRWAESTTYSSMNSNWVVNNL